MVNISLYNNNCFDQLDLLINDGVIVDSILIDLPYGQTSQSWDVVIPFDEMWNKIKKILKPKGNVCIFGSEPFASLLRTSNLEWYKYDWVWEKNNAGNFQLVNYQPLKIHETISVFYNDTPNMEFADIMKYHMERLNLKQIDISKLQLSKNGNLTGWVTNKLNGSQLPTEQQWEKICNLFQIENKYNEILSTVKYPTYNLKLDDTFLRLSNKNKGGSLGHMSSENKRDTYIQNKTGYPKSILKFDREVKYHPTQKPLKLMEFLVKTYTNENDIVLDFVMGSGTTGVACKKLNRNFIGVEDDFNYFRIAQNRIETTQI
jgi:site-specific DNA-methyltransferase (adenine-specific)